jgi:hypothetical protein
MTMSDSPSVQIDWRTISRPGYFGRHREAHQGAFDELYGVGRWRLAWRFGELYIDRAAMSLIYEDAYYTYLFAHQDVLNQLCAEGRDVYDDAITNTASGLDYSAQETERTHVQDIAIRRAMVRLGRSFSGTELIQIRHSDGTHPLSLTLSPGKVPFHRPELICQPQLDGWWDDGSVESFYQSNKYLQARDG